MAAGRPQLRVHDGRVAVPGRDARAGGRARHPVGRGHGQPLLECGDNPLIQYLN